MFEARKMPGLDGDKYIPISERTGGESVVFFTRDLSAEGLRKIYERVKAPLEGKVAIKLHTGEPNGPNIIPRPWVKELIENELTKENFENVLNKIFLNENASINVVNIYIINVKKIT